MQQRRVRLGDVLDDYCPRERRITNHAVVAMIDDEVKQTRCATCEAEHEYKEAKAPAPRRKKAEGVLSADLPEGLVRPRPAGSGDPAMDDDEGVAAAPADDPEAAPPLPEVEDAPPLAAAGAPDEPVSDEEPGGQDDHWVHRPLIRATLPRQEGQTPERKAPDFTMRQPGRFDSNRNGQRQRGGHRPGRPGQGPARQAQGPSGPGSRFAPSGPRGSGQGRHGSGQGSGNPPRHGSGPGPRHGSGPGSGGHGQRPGGNRPGPSGQRGGRPPGSNRGPGRKGGR